MSQSELTLWVKCEHGFQAVIADDDDPSVEEILGGEGVEAIRAKDFEPCKTCEHLDVCMESHWNETRMGQGMSDHLSMVHTCACCDERNLTILYGDKQPKRLVPDDCPRWHPVSGCAIECSGCRRQRREIEKAHPPYKQKMNGIKEIAQSFRDALLAKDEFTTKRHLKKMSGQVVEGMFPGCDHLEDLYQDENVFFMSQEFWMEMLKSFKRTPPEFWDEVRENPPLLAHFTQGGLDYVYHSLVRHPGNVEKVIEELVLFLTDDGHFSRHWARLRVSEKKLVKRSWQGVLRRVWSSYEEQV